jgi:hypothetical protein
MVAKPAEGEGAESREAGETEEKAHLTFGEPEAGTGEWQCCSRLRLGETLDQAGKPHDRNQQPRVPIEISHREDGVEESAESRQHRGLA